MSAAANGAGVPVVVTGIGVACSIGVGVEPFAASLRAGRTGIRRQDGQVSAPLAGFDFAHAVGAVPGLPQELSRRALRKAGRSLPAVQAAVAAALQAWTGAGLPAADLPGSQVGVVVGGNNVTGAAAYRMAERFRGDPVAVPGRFALHVQDTDHVGVLSEILAITGEGYTVGGAAASGNLAVIHGARMVRSGAARACLVVGAMTELSPVDRQSYLALGAMADPAAAPDDDVLCRPFDTTRRGFVAGEGTAALLLEAEPSARARGVRPLARVAGEAMALSANSLADPSEEVEVAVMSTALARAGARPEQLDYVNTHGTASRLGDEVEAAALRRVLGRDSGAWVNATKALTGHCLCGAGAVEAVATVVQMTHGFVHPNPHLGMPLTGELRFAGRQAEPARIGLALSNGFGFGGLHSAVVFAGEVA
ncbi:beta-ketoacyl synthase N-terminal-like domain-containing protein [Catellatospora vulcania]|uniref:beta-ketoacyl synthase N-terminal-like domain-containing protein n=1 Tax=Catellatospora vulcania TaxID=1460450 RepID=UPI0012D47584|nr:beta-ketoacyl synthase N-terminal-like domain-containing protein [Catellatospora vulcania]